MDEQKTIGQELKEATTMSRRSFLKTGAVAGAVTAGTLMTGSLVAGCGPKETPEKSAAESTATSKRWSWETPPAPIPDSKIIETIKSEVVIIGAGVAGLAAACRAKELGQKVVVIEKGKTISLRGLMFAALDSKVMRKYGVKVDKNAVITDWLKTCGGRPSEELVRLFADRSGEVMDWMIDKAEGYGVGVRLYDGQYTGKNHFEYSGTHMFQYNFFPKQGINNTPGWMFWMETEGKGVDYYYETPAEQLVKEGNKVVGVIAQTKKGYKKFLASKAVILATGDISGDKEMVECYSPYSLDRLKFIYMPPGQNTGDGHKMGMWAGAISEMGDYQPMLHPLAYSWLQFGFLHVNARGKRFMNEDTWIQAKSTKLLQQPGKEDFAFTIFDSNWPTQLAKTIPAGGGQFWDGMERTIEEKWTPDKDMATLEADIKKGNAFKADTLEELAKKIGVDKDTFMKTIARYNELAKKGEDIDYGKNPVMMNAIEQGPFYATKWGPTVLVITGGLQINNKTQVIDKGHNPIPGLYAIGNVSGGRYGVDYPVTINGTSLASAVVWGYVAAESIAQG